MKPKIKISIIIATYNWKEALELVLISLLKQTYEVFEILIADDGSRAETKELISKYQSKFKCGLIHIWHEDKGFRLAEIRNKAIGIAKGEYIIQIDGDVILHKDFVKDHANNAKENSFLVGSRVLLLEQRVKNIFKTKNIHFNYFSKAIKNRHYTLRVPLISKFFSTPNNDVQKVIKSVRGCNMSFWKEDLMAVNGYDQDMIGWGREDSEISARLVNFGINKRHLKFAAIQYHIYHPENSRKKLNINDEILSNTVKSNKTFAVNGISKEPINSLYPRKVTAIIPTFNEADNIEAAIKSVAFADEVLVIDSLSTDATVDIANSMNITLIKREFDDFSSQKNYAIRQAKHDWIFMLDADERLTKGFVEEVLFILRKKNIADLYLAPRINFFLEKRIKYSGWQNDTKAVLFDRKTAHYNGRFVHEKIENQGEISFLSNALLHYTFKNHREYKNKILLYAKLKASELFQNNVKPNFFHFYIKPSYRFLYHYIFKYGFLDGENGKIIASLNAYGIKKRYMILKKLNDSKDNA